MARLGLLVSLLVIGWAPAAFAERHATDQPDDLPGYSQVHVMYVLPSDGVDRAYDTDGTIAGSAQAWQNWLIGQTGGRGLNLDTAGGALDITFVRLDRTDADLAAQGLFLRDAIEAGLKARGFTDPNKILAVYYDGSAQNVCGGGAWPPSLTGTVAASYLRGSFSDPGIPPCDSNPWAPAAGPVGYRELSFLHEILHTMGIVPTCAPHHTRSGHVSDSPTDLMYAGNEPWVPSVLDVGRDDYFRASPDPNCLDLARSPFFQGNGAPASGPVDPTPAPGPTPTPGPSPGPTPSPTVTCRVPRLVGLKRTPAIKRIAAARCPAASIRTRRARSRAERRRVGRVVAQTPAAGKTLAAGARIRLTLLKR